MKWMMVFVCMVFASFWSVASERMLNQAVVEDQTLSEIRQRFEALQGQQEDSGVFSDAELDEAQEVIDALGDVKQEELRGVIDALGESLRTEDGSKKRALYTTVYAEYEKVLERLDDVVKEQGKKVRDFAQKRELLEIQKGLLKELKAFEEAEVIDEALDEEDIERLAEMSDAQEKLKGLVDDEALEEKMGAAQEDIEEGDVGGAIEKQEEIVGALEDELAAMGGDEEGALSEDFAALEEMVSDIDGLQEDLADSLSGEDVLSDEERQQMAEEMSVLGQGLEEQGQEGAAGSLEQSLVDVLGEEDQSAYDGLESAKQRMMAQQKQLGAASAKMAKGSSKGRSSSPPPGLPEGSSAIQAPTGDAKSVALGKGDGSRGRVSSGREWTAGLPERERSALHVARQAKYSPQMEDDVRKYFIELAK